MIDHLTTSGPFVLDGEEIEVENNVFIVGDEREVIVIDAPHSAEAVAAAAAGRGVVAIVATHGHSDHIDAAPELSFLLDAPVLLHRDDLGFWHEVHGDDLEPAGELAEGDVLKAGGVTLSVLHTPGHTAGGCCLYDEAAGVVFSGDTLFKGGPGATGRRGSHFDTIISSIRARLLSLPPETRVLPGHGEETTIGSEAAHLEEWIARGH